MNTLITRRIDDLGRIVIPKEIRNKLKIKQGDCLSISLEDEKIVFKKKSLVADNFNVIESVVKTISKLENIEILITDLDKVIYSNSRNIPIKTEINAELSKEIFYGKEKIVDNKEIFNKRNNYLIQPIIVNGDIIGSVIIINLKKISESNLMISKIISNLLIKHLEV